MTVGARAIAKEAGITYRQLDMWVRWGYLHPSAVPSQGFLREWPDDERFVAIEMGRLVRAGMQVSAAAELARRYVTEPTADGKYLIGIGVSIIFED